MVKVIQLYITSKSYVIGS